MITSSDDFFKNFEVSNIGCLTELTVGSDERLKLSVHVNPDECRRGDEYFKVYNSHSYKKAEKVARIKFKEPLYIDHDNEDGKENWCLKSRDRKKLIRFLSSKNDDNPSMTNWQVAITLFNQSLGKRLIRVKKKSKSNKSPEYPEKLSTDLKMPDYSRLCVK